MTSTTLHNIEHETGQDAEYYFTELLTAVLSEGSGVELTWGKIVETVRKIGHGSLADQLFEKYGIYMGEGGRGGREGEGG